MKQEIKEKVAQCFESNPKDKAYYVCGDGQCFVDRNMAIAHQGDIGLKAEDVVEVSREEILEDYEEIPEPKWAEMTIDEVKETAADIEELDYLKQVLEKVKSKGGKEAVQERIQELEQ